MERITRKRNQRITNHGIVLIELFQKFRRNGPVIDDPLVPLPRNPLHGTLRAIFWRTESSGGISVIGCRVRYARYARIAIRAMGRHLDPLRLLNAPIEY